MFKLNIFFASVLSVLSDTYISGPSGKRYFEDNSTVRRFAEAVDYCQLRNASVLSLDSQNEYEFVKNLARLNNNGHWLAAKAFSNALEYRWTQSGELITTTISPRWWMHEPNCQISSSVSSCCLTQSIQRLGDDACDALYYTICQLDQRDTHTPVRELENSVRSLEKSHWDLKISHGTGMSALHRDLSAFQSSHSLSLDKMAATHQRYVKNMTAILETLNQNMTKMAQSVRMLSNEVSIVQRWSNLTLVAMATEIKDVQDIASDISTENYSLKKKVKALESQILLLSKENTLAHNRSGVYSTMLKSLLTGLNDKVTRLVSQLH
ncbi:hypothetical protein HDE_06692 [Halotydeus destructor]|nr:hypothetical protein HDE_06692 [Halotydeus destructor]